MARPRHITTNDISKRVGVSRATVSVVLNGARSTIRVSDSTRERVLEAATELGYSPHPAAQALRRQRSGVIGYIPRQYRPGPLDEPIPLFLNAHINRAALRHGYRLLEAPSGADYPQSGEELAAFLLSHRVEGVLVDSPSTPEVVQRLVDNHLPVVQLMRPQASVLTSTITVDASVGISDAVDHLVALGHRRIAYQSERDGHPVVRDRLRAMVAALERHKLPLPDTYAEPCDTFDLATGYAAARRLMQLNEPPTAIVLAGDLLTLGVLHYLYEVGIRVPDSVSLVSYDDTLMAMLYPPVTAVAQPLQDIAEHAAETIVDEIARRDATHDAGPSSVRHVKLPTNLVVRASTAPVSRSDLPTPERGM